MQSTVTFLMRIAAQTAQGCHIYALLSIIQYRRVVDGLVEYTLKTSHFRFCDFYQRFTGLFFKTKTYC